MAPPFKINIVNLKRVVGALRLFFAGRGRWMEALRATRSASPPIFCRRRSGELSASSPREESKLSSGSATINSLHWRPSPMLTLSPRRHAKIALSPRWGACFWERPGFPCLSVFRGAAASELSVGGWACARTHICTCAVGLGWRGTRTVAMRDAGAHKLS